MIFSAPGVREIVSVPAKRPIKPVYIRQFVALPPAYIAVTIVLALGAVAAWGILESVLLAGVFTLIETGGLVLLIAAAAHSDLALRQCWSRFPHSQRRSCQG